MFLEIMKTKSTKCRKCQKVLVKRRAIYCSLACRKPDEKKICHRCKTTDDLVKGGKAQNHPDIQLWICRKCSRRQFKLWGRDRYFRLKYNPEYKAKQNEYSRRYQDKHKK